MELSVAQKVAARVRGHDGRAGAQRASLQRRIRPMLRRAIWASLVFVHIAPLVSVCRTLSVDGLTGRSIFSAVCLSLAIAFFALKFLDVKWLRWRCNRTSVLMFVLVCGLVHQNATVSEGGPVLFAEASGAIAVSVLWPILSRGCRWIPKALRLFADGIGRRVAFALVLLEILHGVVVNRRLRQIVILLPARAPPC